MTTLIKTVSPQAREVYKLLEKGKQLNAQDIADELGILPNAVYRVAGKLIELGMIEEISTYPTSYKAVPKQTALSFYLLAASYNFRREFGIVRPSGTKNNAPTIGLIKDRATLLRRSDQDARVAKQSIDIIVSGHEVPGETLLAFQKASMSGVAIRKIVHQKEQANSPLIKEWKDIGASLKYLPDFQLRMLIFDKRIVYITSYDAKNNKSAFGVRFEYEPLALQMTELFEQNWQKAEEL